MLLARSGRWKDVRLKAIEPDLGAQPRGPQNGELGQQDEYGDDFGYAAVC
jgi:hypothetical protein